MLRSSPGSVAGRSMEHAADLLGHACGCDPRPARWPGAARCVLDLAVNEGTMLRSSPGSVAGRSSEIRDQHGHYMEELRSSPGSVAGRSLACRTAGDPRARVAILARLGGRAQLKRARYDEVDRAKLRSSPGSVAGRSSHGPPQDIDRRRRCDPRPARWPGAAPGRDTGAARVGVAILARLGGRAQPGAGRARRSPGRCCDPRPARWPGAAYLSPCSTSWMTMLRSSPCSVAGRSPSQDACRGNAPSRVAILARLGGRAQLVVRDR